MADNSVGRQQSMAEHEIEMQRQIMSVAPGSVPGPPQPPSSPAGMAPVIPPTLSIPPPPMPPSSGMQASPQTLPPGASLSLAPSQNLPPPGITQNMALPPVIRAGIPPPSRPPSMAQPPVLPPINGISGVPPPQIRLPPPGLPPPGPPQSVPPSVGPRAILSGQLPPPGAPPNIVTQRSVPGTPPTLPISLETPPPNVLHVASAPQTLPPPGTPSGGALPVAPSQSTAAMPPSASVPTLNVNVATPGPDAQLPTSGASVPMIAHNSQPWNGASDDPQIDDSDDRSKDSDDDADDKKPTEVILPKALEDVLALKDQRAAQFEGDIFIVEDEKLPVAVTAGVISTEYADADGDSDDDADLTINERIDDKPTIQGKLNKNKRKKKRRKQSRKLRLDVQNNYEKVSVRDFGKVSNSKKQQKKDEDVTIEYIPERITVADLAPMYRQFYRVFEIFKLENKPKLSEADKTGSTNESHSQQKKPDEKTMDEDDDDPEEDKKDDKEKLSKRKLKKLTRLSVAELKQLVNRPDVVEMHDVTARDPKLLVQLKAHRNTVQVPRHWCFKRKYLQGKRGIEKPPFDLPAFIKKTGIMEMRESLQEKDEAKSLKAKMRERARPKMGKIDIDYQKLHDAFFKWQTKPRMTIHGDLYYEGKEFETRLKEKKPGDLSEELRIALGMPVGPNCHKIPPPWLIAQQRYGPPPSYPNLKIPGLNAPIPDGTSFGYHAGGWGKPPVDENGKPLYGDVFGTNIVDVDNGIDEGDIERNTWGELESESEESSEEEEDEGEDLVNAPDESGLVTPAEGLVTPSGLTSVPAGMETPDNIELRKRKIEAEMEDNETPVLYQVLPEKRTDRIGVSMMGSTHVYDIGAVKTAAMNAAASTRQPAIGDREGMVELALDPSELDMDNDAMAQRYEQQMREQQSHLQKEDLSDMLAEHVARQKSKRKRQQADTSKQTKKYKEFKF